MINEGTTVHVTKSAKGPGYDGIVITAKHRSEKYLVKADADGDTEWVDGVNLVETTPLPPYDDGEPMDTAEAKTFGNLDDLIKDLDEGDDAETYQEAHGPGQEAADLKKHVTKSKRSK
jgi:hypothetical protein